MLNRSQHNNIYMDKEFNKTESDQPEQIDQTFTKPDKSGEFIVFEDFMRLFSAAINNPALAKRLKALRINRRKNPKKYPPSNAPALTPHRFSGHRCHTRWGSSHRVR